VDTGRRRELTRFGAPAAFLAAATIAILLIKAGLESGSKSQPPPAGVLPTTAHTTTRAATSPKLVLTGTTTAATTSSGRYYVIQTGDTLGSIALKYETTVEQLLTLNPDVDPAALHPGDRIRVG
jgi:LysM repeat protein